MWGDEEVQREPFRFYELDPFHLVEPDVGLHHVIGIVPDQHIPISFLGICEYNLIRG